MADPLGASTLPTGTTSTHNTTKTSTKKEAVDAPLSKAAEWRRCLLLAFVGLPIFALLCVCAYGFIVWFMQILFWGPPT